MKKKNFLKLTLCDEVKPNCLAGYVECTSGCEVVGIFVNDAHLRTLRIRGAYITMSNNWTSPVILMDTETYEGIKQKENQAMFTLYHELGHYFCGHMKTPSTLDNEMTLRTAEVEKGTAAKDEIDADIFAAEFLGAYEVVHALREAQGRRFKHDFLLGARNTELCSLTIREYENRILAVTEHFGLNNGETC